MNELISRNKSAMLLALYATAVTVFYYQSAINNFFVWDDFWFLMVSGGDAKTVLLGTPTLRILGNIIFWLNFKMFSLDPSGYTVVSIAVHIVNILLIYAFLKTLTQNDKFSFLSAAVYASLSVYCDTVISKASFLTATNVTFYCVVLILYLKSKSVGRYYLWSLIVFFFAMFNKEEIASIPFVIILLELLFFEGTGKLQQIVKKAMPYAIIVVAYVATSVILTRTGIMFQEQFERLGKFRPLHSLLGGFASFIARPDGFLWNRGTLIAAILLALALPTALYFSRNRKLVLLGIGWVFLTFLPQSYSNLTQYTPKYLFMSISRHLYIPSIGAAMVVAAIILFSGNAERKWLANGIIVLLLAGLVTYNAPLVHSRSLDWGNNPDAVGMQRFLGALKSQVPVFEKGAHIIVDEPMTGRAYMLRALRAYYQNDVVYVYDPASIELGKIPSLYYVENRVMSGQGVTVRRLK